MKKISFIVPSWHYYLDALKHQPYWEIYYATVVKQAGYDADIIDMRVLLQDDLQTTVEKVEERDFYFNWIFKTGDASEIYSISALLKKKYPNSIHAAGGTHVDMCPEENEKFMDATITGPGEIAFIQIIEDAKKKILRKRYIESYRALPFANTPYPDRSLLPDEYAVNDKLFSQYGDIKGTLVYFSRGCVFQCAYCTYNVPRQLQTKSPEMIKNEIRYLKERYQIKGVLVKDEIAISPNKAASKETLQAMIDSDIVWRGQTTTHASADQLKMARESGCLELAVGIETVSDDVMKIINKAWQTKDKIRHFVENCKKNDIKVKICLILGLPGEPMNIVDETIRFLEEIQPDFASVSGFLPNPGSPIAENYQKFGIKYIDKDWNKYGHLLFRFSDNEDIGLPFEYHKETPWGPSFTRNEIQENIITVQQWLDERDKVY